MSLESGVCEQVAVGGRVLGCASRNTNVNAFMIQNGKEQIDAIK